MGEGPSTFMNDVMLVTITGVHGGLISQENQVASCQVALVNTLYLTIYNI